MRAVRFNTKGQLLQAEWRNELGSAPNTDKGHLSQWLDVAMSHDARELVNLRATARARMAARELQRQREAKAEAEAEEEFAFLARALHAAEARRIPVSEYGAWTEAYQLGSSTADRQQVPIGERDAWIDRYAASQIQLQERERQKSRQRSQAHSEPQLSDVEIPEGRQAPRLIYPCSLCNSQIRGDGRCECSGR